MNSSETYPGSDLTITQLVYALDRKLNVESTNCVTARSDYTPEKLIEVEKSFVWCIAGVRAFRNAFSPINRLHPETIAFILGLVAYECLADPPGNWDGPYDWVAVSHVCRYWRNTTLSFPSMWSTIESARPRMARHSLKLSKSAPIDVVLDVSSPDYLFEGVQTNLLRVRRLKIHLDVATRAAKLTGFNNSPAPLLEHLELHLNAAVLTQSTIHLPPLFQANMPFLKCLRLYGFSLEHPISHITNLVELKLINEGSTRPTSMVRLLDVFHSNQKLRQVRLENSGPRRVDDAHPSAIIKLNNIECLKLIGCSAQMILSHLALPRGAQLVVADYFRSGTDGFAQVILPRALDYLENLHEPQTLGFQKVGGRICVIEALAPEDSAGVQGSMLLAAQCLSGTLLPAFYQRSFHLMQPLCVAQVKHLWLQYVDFDIENPQQLPGPIQLALVSMPNLETLVLLQCKTGAFFQALLPANDAAPCVCPQLRTLIIYDPQSFSPADLLAMTTERKYRSAPFENVSLIFHHTRFVSIPQLTLLKKVVEVVKCEVDDEGPKWPFKQQQY